MRYEFTTDQIETILRGLDALEEAAESENRCTDDPDIRESNDGIMKAVSELRKYLTGHKETISNGRHTFELVDHIPADYHIWNIGKNMVDGYLPLCKMKQRQSADFTMEVEPDTLKAVKCEGAQVILEAVGYGPSTPKQMEAYIKKYEGGSRSRERAVERMKAALPYMHQIRWEADR